MPCLVIASVTIVKFPLTFTVHMSFLSTNIICYSNYFEFRYTVLNIEESSNTTLHLTATLGGLQMQVMYSENHIFVDDFLMSTGFVLPDSISPKCCSRHKDICS